MTKIVAFVIEADDGERVLATRDGPFIGFYDDEETAALRAEIRRSIVQQRGVQVRELHFTCREDRGLLEGS